MAEQGTDAPRRLARANARRIARRARDAFPVTALGAAVATLTGVAVWFGLGEADLILLGAAMVAGVAVVLDLVCVLLATLRTRAALRKIVEREAPYVLECGYATRTDFRLPRLWWLPGVRLSWRWESPAAKVRLVRAGGYLEEEVLAEARGFRERLTRRVELAGPFGLAAIAVAHEEARPVRMLPSVGGLRSMHVVRTLSGGSDITHPEGTPDGDRLDIRQYAPGDPIRFVLWNVFAKTREMVVRTPERALSHAKKTLAYLVAGAGDEPAAGAARVAVDIGALGGDWAFGADGVAEAATTKEAAFEALARSGSAPREEAGLGLAAFVKNASAEKSGRAVVFVPGRAGPWLDGVIRSAKTIPADAMGRMPLEFVVCTDGVRKSSSVAWLRRHSLRATTDAPDGLVDADDLARVVQALGTLRARVVVVDRRDGHVHLATGR